MASSILSNADLKTLEHHFQDWCSSEYREDFSLLITGKSGVGKSSLVNALVGKLVAEEGRRKKQFPSEVTSYCAEAIEGITVRVYGSPGIQDGTGNEESYLADIKQKITGELDLVIFCMRMDDNRFCSEDRKTIQILTDTFGKELWNNAVIALTFANRVEDQTGGDKKAFFLEELENWREEIYLFLRDDLEIDSEQRQSLPIVPTGYYRRPSGLPNCENWLSSFWSACYQVARSSAAFNLYRMNRGRIRFHGSDNLAPVTGEFAEETESQSFLSTAPTTASQSPRDFDFTALTAAGPSPGGIPVIELGEKEQDSFWKKTWEIFKEHGLKTGLKAALKAGVILGAIVTVGFTVLKLLK